MLRQVGASEVIVFLESHAGIEAAIRPICNEEVTQDKIVCCDCLLAEGHALVAQWEDTTQPWSFTVLLAVTSGPQLCQQEGCSSNRREANAVGGSCSFIASIKCATCNLLQVTIEVVPMHDVVGDLHAWLLSFRSIIQCHVAGRDELSSNLGVQTKGTIGCNTGFIDVPYRLSTCYRQHNLDICNELQAPLVCRTPRGDNSPIDLIGTLRQKGPLLLGKLRV
mmetsp:Transcript_9546/g.21330  ORF Transcript_9546/g.21330 Transcript_9546/m.21330 type:complete len:222 (+) Transcript_9546:335-1000(+)